MITGTSRGADTQYTGTCDSDDQNQLCQPVSQFMQEVKSKWVCVDGRIELASLFRLVRSLGLQGSRVVRRRLNLRPR